MTALFYNSEEQPIVENPELSDKDFEWTIYIINRLTNQHHLTHIQKQVQHANSMPPPTPKMFVVEWSHKAACFYKDKPISTFYNLYLINTVKLSHKKLDKGPVWKKQPRA